jgi:hypothetical protein
MTTVNQLYATTVLSTINIELTYSDTVDIVQLRTEADAHGLMNRI